MDKQVWCVSPQGVNADARQETQARWAGWHGQVQARRVHKLGRTPTGRNRGHTLTAKAWLGLRTGSIETGEGEGVGETVWGGDINECLEAGAGVRLENLAESQVLACCPYRNQSYYLARASLLLGRVDSPLGGGPGVGICGVPLYNGGPAPHR